MSLKALQELLRVCRVESCDTDEAEMELSAKQAIDCALVTRLFDLMTAEIRTAGGDVLQPEPGTEIPASGKIVLSSLPRDGETFVGKTLSDLITNGEHYEREPSEWILLSATGGTGGTPIWSGQPEPLPREISAYRCAIALIAQLKAHADHHSAITYPPTVTFFDVERLDIQLRYKVGSLSQPFPIDDLRDFLAAESSPLVRIESFKGTLWDFLKDFEPQERLPRLLRGGEDFMRRLKRNFAIARTDFRLDRRLEIARTELANYSETVSKMVLGLEAKAFALPGALILSARVVKKEGGWDFANTSVLAGTLLVALILTTGYLSQREIVAALKDEIEEAKSRLDIDSNDHRLGLKFDSLLRRIWMAGLVKIIMVITAWVLFIAMGIMFCSFGSSNEAGNAP